MLPIVLVIAATTLAFNGQIRSLVIATAPESGRAAQPTVHPTALLTVEPIAHPTALLTVEPTPSLPQAIADAGGTAQEGFAGPPYKGLPGSVRLKIPRFNIDAPIVPVGLSAEGEVESPPGPELVGWYNLSPPPGAPGNSILAGHVDWKNRTAVFWELRHIEPGDAIFIASPDRADIRFTVEWVRRYTPEEAPIDTIFASLYEPTLTIITCEGVFDPATRNYSLRLVVRARGT